jgi:hypothetical protein
MSTKQGAAVTAPSFLGIGNKILAPTNIQQFQKNYLLFAEHCANDRFQAHDFVKAFELRLQLIKAKAGCAYEAEQAKMLRQVIQYAQLYADFGLDIEMAWKKYLSTTGQTPKTKPVPITKIREPATVNIINFVVEPQLKSKKKKNFTEIVEKKRKRVRQTGERDHEPVEGFENYKLVALKVSWQYFRRYFDSVEEREQLACETAALLVKTFGQRTTLKNVQAVAGKLLREYRKAHGWRQKTSIRPEDGKRIWYYVRLEMSA